MRQAVVAILFVMVSLLSAFAADLPHRLTLAQCLKMAEKEQPDLAAARALILSTQQEIQIAKAGYRPHLDSGTSYTWQSYNYAGTPGTPPKLVTEFSNWESMSSAPYYYLGMNLSQTIYDFGLTRGSVRRGEADFDAAQQNYQRVHDLVYLNVRQAY
ncbi:MAG: TolC family protein [Acidobacteriia bacterium]|nr:TolC family protein [Terriglobia bacterium]